MARPASASAGRLFDGKVECFQSDACQDGAIGLLCQDLFLACALSSSTRSPVGERHLDAIMQPALLSDAGFFFGLSELTAVESFGSLARRI